MFKSAIFLFFLPFIPEYFRIQFATQTVHSKASHANFSVVVFNSLFFREQLFIIAIASLTLEEV